MSAPSAAIRLGLIGAPNSGKTTLFNALTGLRAKVANYPGVTVERREAQVSLGARAAVVIDLPGTYSLEPLSPDEAVVLRVLDGELAAAPDALVVVADACSLERSLPFVAQVLLRGRPTCLVLTMIDELAARGGTIDLARLERALGIPVLGVIGHRGRGLDALVRLLGRPEDWSRPVLPPPSDPLERSHWADSVFASVAGARPGIHRMTEAIDRVVLHPVAGTLLFAAVMVTFFQLIFAWATPAMDAIDAGIVAGAAFLHAVAAAGPAGRLPRRRSRRGGRRGDRVPAPDRAAIRAPVPARGRRLHGARGVRGGPPDGPRRPRGARVRGAPVLVRVRGARHHGDAHDSLAARSPGHDPRRAADDLLRAAARVRAADRRVRARRDGLGAARAPGPRAARALPARQRVRARDGGAVRAHAAAELGASVLPRAALVSHADGEALALAGVEERVGVRAPRGHDHPHRERGALGAAALPAERPAAGREPRSRRRATRSSTASPDPPGARSSR